MQRLWTGVGTSYPSKATARRSGAESPRAANAEGAARSPAADVDADVDVDVDVDEGRDETGGAGTRAGAALEKEFTWFDSDLAARRPSGEGPV